MANSNLLQTNITPLQQMISSCSGALLTSVFVTPLDVVKTRLQAQQKTSKRCFLYCNGFVEEFCCGVHAVGPSSYWQRSGQLTGTLDAFAKITRTEGVRSLWSGLPPTLVMAVPGTVAYYTMYDQILYSMKAQCQWSKQPLWLPAVAGGFARVFAATLVSPIELVRTKMQSQKISYNEISVAIRNQISNQGLRSMWQGLGPTVLRDVPFSCIYWFHYELLKEHFNQRDPTFWFSFTAGAISGSIAALMTVPFDVIKTHRQIELGEASTHSRSHSTSTYNLMKTLYQSNGYKSLFAGIVPRLTKVAPGCAIMISSYEYGKQFFHNYNATKSTNLSFSCLEKL
ncbi:mitochondrial glutathione transporter SLC25A40 [Parasteatoda tepidariorum]|uniref:mitochondrial glutathione transporter SLC25A40 n=1 Tax=Parasteatoda tepidariorum TaxID=114398 RepID=UPI00077FA2B9|nr:solute carrier family 25 member 40 [Parasteatoda tepidariorum]